MNPRPWNISKINARRRLRTVGYEAYAAKRKGKDTVLYDEWANKVANRSIASFGPRERGLRETTAPHECSGSTVALSYNSGNRL